jgi:flavin reductase ActVB
MTAADTVSGQVFREAMSRLAAPIAIVTCVDGAGRRWGFTASSVMSMSLEPPLVGVAIGRSSGCHAALTGSSDFLINVLGRQHCELARRFATPGIDRFANGDLADEQGLGLADAHARLRCRAWGIFPAGDHDLVVGALIEVRMAGPESMPLLWHQRAAAVPQELEISHGGEA